MNKELNYNFENRFEYVECKDYLILVEELKKYIKSESDIISVIEAYKFAESMHKSQLRKSGEPFIIHPLSCAYYLAQWRMGPKTIIAGLLHDVIEDTPVTFSDIEDKYGLDVANLVEAVTKVSFFTKENREQMKASYLRKLFVSMVKDIRVIVIKIADRMHNLLTLEHMTVEKQNKIAQETLDIYSSIAHRLGMKVAKNILEDYSFKILNLEEYNRIERLVEEDLAVRSTYINEIIEDLESKLKYEYFFNNVAVMGRQKTIYSIYRKMNSFNKNFSDINDILAVRILCESVDDCYRILGYVHQNYSQLNGRFKDYISTPKNNLYQSIHTTVVSKKGIIFEVQIRTYEMDEIAEQGAAAHWKYKEVGESDPTKIQLELDNKIDMFNKLINIDKMGDNEDDEKNDNLMEETFKSDYLTPTIYLLTQNSSIITLPLGSTVIDFAYKMSTEIGHTTIGAKINGVFSPINTTLNSGEIVEIKTSADSRPEPWWTKYARTTAARTEIDNYLNNLSQQESCLKIENEEKIIKNASKEIERYISSQNLKDDVYSDIKKVEQKVKELDFVDLNSFLLAVGEGVFTIAEAVNLAYLIKENDLSQTELNDIKTRKYRNEKGRNDILINNMEKISCKLSECCYPIPFENIIATISNEAGIYVHRAECENLLDKNSYEASLTASWIKKKTESNLYKAKIRVAGDDTPGLLYMLTKKFAQLKINLIELKLIANPKEFVFKGSLICQVKKLDDLNVLISNIRNTPGMIQVVRVMSKNENN